MGKELGVKESDYARSEMDKRIYDEKLGELRKYMKNDIEKVREEIKIQEKMMSEDLKTA